MKCLLALCAEKIIRDIDSGLISVVNLLEDVTMLGLPGVISELSCVFLVEREPGDAERTNGSVLLTMGDEEILRGPIVVRFNGNPKFRQVLHIQGIIVPRPGVLRASLVVDDAELGAWEMTVRSARHDPQIRLPLQPDETPRANEATSQVSAE
jgi:hypothetical protein